MAGGKTGNAYQSTSQEPKASDLSSDKSLTEKEFRQFQQFIFDTAGITMSDAKHALVSGRLGKRLKHHGFDSYQRYFEYITATSPSLDQTRERQAAIDLLTTNETYFYREPKHFDYLKEHLLPRWKTGNKRIWSAACSSGEEPYTLAMLMQAHCATEQWEIVASDISTRVLDTARSGQYPLDRIRHLPKNLLHTYCLKGIGSKAGTVLVNKGIRARVGFQQANLKEPNEQLGVFDVIFLRNVMIYFSPETKQQVVSLILERLRPGGLLFIGHSESLHGITDAVELIQPSIYRKSE